VTSSNFVLKNSDRRTTEIVGAEPGLVRKLFHSRGLRSFTDRRRALKEFRILQKAKDSGLPVPTPREVTRSSGSWSLSMDRIPGARSLRDLIEKNPSTESAQCPTDSNFDRSNIAKQLGKLLAKLAAAGIEHCDLHLGNLLVDPGGQLWLLDFARSKVRSGAHPAGGYRDLVTLCASMRECSSRAEREGMLDAFYAVHGSALAGTALAGTGGVNEFMERVELEARLERRSRILRNLGRWMRTSGVALNFEVEGKPALCARFLSDEQRLRPFAILTGSQFAISDQRLTFQATNQKAAVQAWMSSALLYEHRIRTPRPHRILFGNSNSVEFEVPMGCELLLESKHEFTAEHLATSYGELIGSLHERGLKPVSISTQQLLICSSGSLLALPGLCFEKAVSVESALEVGAELMMHNFMTPDTRVAFSEGYERALKHPLAIDSAFSSEPLTPDSIA
jgi:tRNA A-37 threonylcarbamoyl transferase component Bud32